jgi:HSP20 family protein
MTKLGKLARKDMPAASRFDDMFEEFRKEMAAMMSSWPGMGLLGDTRVPLCDIADRGSKYELHVEVPGIDKDRVQVKATQNAVEISGRHSEKSEEKKKGYYYSERSARSFYRMIPVPEEIDPSKVTASMNNGILSVELPKVAGKHGTSRKVHVK